MIKRLLLSLSLTILAISLAESIGTSILVPKGQNNSQEKQISGLKSGFSLKDKIPASVALLYSKFRTKYGLKPDTPSEDKFRLSNFNQNLERIKNLKE